MRIQPNQRQTTRRYRKLQIYYSEQVLAGSRFCCDYWSVCKASYTSEAGHFAAGQLNAPGSHYDLTVNDQPLRIVIVGQESGIGIPHTSMRRRRVAIARTATAQRFVAEAGYSARTQHMKGITSALRLLFGNGLGTDYAGEHVTLIDGTQVHLLHCFALVNYLLCSAHSTKRSKRGESTTTMRRNCNAHFRATLEILEPTVILVGGKSMWPHVQRAFDELTPVAEPIFKASFKNSEALVASFTHPSAMHPHNWGINVETPYLLKTVVPTLAQMRTLIWGA
ncbi:hypothetical protein KFU94_45055 [Chloroflexi bacterium TSY]|nr:hypothetical protein [Chloroflexi bacterium TSY]